MRSKTTLHNIEVTGLSDDGRGIAKVDEKTVFIEQSVPGDKVDIQVIEQHENYDCAHVINLLSASDKRSVPFCQYSQSCGGCQLQHIDINTQRHWKNRNFITRLTKSVNNQFTQIQPPIFGADKGYRRRARFGLAISKKDKQARLGFRQKQSNDLIDIEQCPVLSDALNQTLKQQREHLISTASRSEREVNLVEADNGCFIHIDKLNDCHEKCESAEKPFYEIDHLKLAFPRDGFVQVNAEINQKMIKQAIDWLELKKHHSVLDLFCGVGNFTLPLAQHCKTIIGIEGLSELVNTAKSNAQTNHLINSTFYKANLFDECRESSWFRKQKYDRILLDPGRQGAFEISKILHLLKPKVIVYVSCNAATLIRDIKELEKQGYLLHKACLMDMFPHTTHAEVMVQLKKVKQTKKRDNRVFKF